MKKKIVQSENPILRKHAEIVAAHEFGSKELSKTIRDMIDSLDGESDGVALAAPQIAVSKRIFIISNKVREALKDITPDLPLVYINPEITHRSRPKVMNEGCLSVRPLYGKTRRANLVTLKAADQSGKNFEITARGLIAQIFQHETDHLNGILFIDHAKNIHEEPLLA